MKYKQETQNPDSKLQNKKHVDGVPPQAEGVVYKTTKGSGAARLSGS